MPKSKRKYVPSQSIRRLITLWEGSSMRTNNSFESEATMFQNYLERAGIFDLMSQDELDGLYSYSYNVGSGNFAKRTLPHLIKLYNGTGTLENVLRNIYGKRDSEPGLPGLRARRQYERNLFAKGYRNRISKLKPKKVAENNITTVPEIPNEPQVTLDIMGQLLPLVADYLQEPTVQDLVLVENKNVRYPVRKRSIENQLQGYYNGGKLIKKGQLGTPIYHKELYLEKDPVSEDEQNYDDLASRVSTINFSLRPEERMDLTTLLLNERLSTYKPTKELKLASGGIKHELHWWDYLSTLPIVIPAAGVAATTAPEWGPTALTTVSNPAFWGELIKDTGAYIAADAAFLGLTGKGIGAHVNNAIGLPEEEHPIGLVIGLTGTSILRKPVQKAIMQAYKAARGAIQPEYALSLAMDLALWKPYVSRVVGENGKIRLRLPSHSDEMPREIVLEPLGNNKFYAHIRTWNDVEGKVPADLTPREIGYLYESLYNELPEGAEILFPKSGPGNYATRGTVAGLQRLARDPRFSKGSPGTLLYIDKDGSIKEFTGTSFIKAPTNEAKKTINLIQGYRTVVPRFIENVKNSDMASKTERTLKAIPSIINPKKVKIFAKSPELLDNIPIYHLKDFSTKDLATLLSRWAEEAAKGPYSPNYRFYLGLNRGKHLALDFQSARDLLSMEKLAERYGRYLSTRYNQLLEKITDPVLRHIVEVSPLYMEEVYALLMNVGKATPEFVRELIKRANSYRRFMSGPFSAEDFSTFRGHSVRENNMGSIDVEGRIVSGNYGTFPAYFEGLPNLTGDFSTWWDQRIPQGVNVRRGMHDSDIAGTKIINKVYNNKNLKNTNTTSVMRTFNKNYTGPRGFIDWPVHLQFYGPKGTQLPNFRVTVLRPPEGFKFGKGYKLGGKLISKK